MPRKYTTEERISAFWSKVKITADDEKCWNWKGAFHRDGYGQFLYNGKIDVCNRVVWMILYGEIPNNLHVLHTCDNPACVNPKHLFLGTHKQNMEDKGKKGRVVTKIVKYGEENVSAKITAEDVKQIRSLYASGGYTQKEIGKLYNLTQTTVSMIIRRKFWKQIA